MKLYKSLIFILSLILFLSCNNLDKKPTIEIEKGMVGMIGYGSLMSHQSTEQTLNRKYLDSVYLVHLENFQRAWNYHISVKEARLNHRNWYYLDHNDTIPLDNIIALNIMPVKESKMNCALYFITQDELKNFDKREIGYERIDVTDLITEFNFKGGQVFAYKALPNYIFNPDKVNGVSKIPKDYLELVTNACDSIGNYFRKEYDSTTIQMNPELIAPTISELKQREVVIE